MEYDEPTVVIQAAQAVFDTVVDAIRRQGERSMNADGMCAYRGRNNTKCAIGHLIPDEEYEAGMENLDWFRLRRNWDHLPTISRLRLFDGFHNSCAAEFLEALQDVHDRGHIDGFNERAMTFAQEFGLIYRKP